MGKLVVRRGLGSGEWVECTVPRGRGGRAARVDRQGRKVPAESSVPGLGTYSPPQSFLLHPLRWGLSWSGIGPMGPGGNPSVFCERSYFLMYRVLKEKIPSVPRNGEVLPWR